MGKMTPLPKKITSKQAIIAMKYQVVAAKANPVIKMAKVQKLALTLLK